MLRIKSTIYLTGQANYNDRNSKIQTMPRPRRFWSRAAQALATRVEYWNLRFIWDLVLGICDFMHKTPRQSRRTLTWPRGPGFSGLNKQYMQWDIT
jgi:hypothetical protein